MDVQRSHGQAGRAFDVMPYPRRHPNGLLRRHDPCALASAHRHDPGNGIDQLCAKVVMERESMWARMIAGHRHNRPVGVIQIAGMGQDFGLAVSRH
jgi:hypothetical protein